MTASHLNIDAHCGCSEDGKGCLCVAPCACHGYGPKLEGFLIPCLLLFLKRKPAHGYELMEELSRMPFLKSLPDPGVIYRQLRRMKTDDLVQSHLEPGKNGPARTVYSLSPQGVAYLLACTASLEGIRAMIEGFLAFTPASPDQEDAP
ncbi:PadR family transcriptional regulator [Oxalobacter vibrioformis]|uniref:PadR family transcriptional regulator n=1 Tax=Oxalobacter vibrioformis TaxID=933080 RepID=A0A9E9P2Q6_9BURK|nr:PadR family transcriptional regulator [Oxalobacter vibrioformis]WAW10154.1 PadR family transcriptional regulator [Oxalobacter vibrioformis]